MSGLAQLAPRLLLSREVLALHGDALRTAASGAAVEFVVLEDAAADATQTVNAAFISRDITGLSTKHLTQQPLLDCYAVLRRSPALAWVHTHSAGADRPIYAELRARGVAVTTSSGANAQVVAHTALAGLLALARRFPTLMQAQRERRWAPLQAGPAPRDLAGQTAVLVGWGPIARALQPLLALLGMKVVVVRQSAEPAGPGIETVRFDRLQTVLPRADALLLACPLNAQTHGLINTAALRAMPAASCLINVSRGEVVVQHALIKALQTGHLGGAFLDVFEHEPLPAESPLWALPGVIVTPHSAGFSDSHAPRVLALFCDNLRRWLHGEPLLHAVA